MILDKINKDLTAAMKDKNTVKVSTIRMLKAAINNKRIEKKSDKLSDDDIIQIISKQVKQRKDSIEEYKKGNRNDLAEKESAELKILEEYMPEQLSKADIEKEVRKAVDEVSATSKKDFGTVMRTVMPSLKGKADGKLISQVLNEILLEKEKESNPEQEG